jgi:G3E family GTPase
MALRVTTVYGLSHTYLESSSVSLLGLSPKTVGLMYARTGNSDEPLRYTVYDARGILESDLVRMQHECMSCLVREHTYEELRRIDGLGQWRQALVTFPTGVDPAGFAYLVHAFQEEDAPDFTVVVDTALSLVDTLLLGEQVTSSELLREWDLAVFGKDERTIGEVLAKQIEFSDRLLLANLDRLSASNAAAARELLTFLNPEADQVLLDADGRCHEPSIGLGRFDLSAPRRTNPLGSDVAPHPVTGRSFQSVIWHRNRPLHPGRLADALDDALPGSIRSRGQLWFATQPDRQIGWESSGPMCSLAALSTWEHVETGAECFLYLIGENCDCSAIIAALDETLLTDEEMAMSIDVWRNYENPFASDLGLLNTDTEDEGSP